MKTKLFILPILLICNIVSGQKKLSLPCNYDSLRKQGIAYLADKNFEKALLKFNSARRCDPTKSVEIDVEIQKALVGIRKQRDEAKALKEKAEKALLNLKKTTKDVIRYLIKEANKYILNLEYEIACKILHSTATYERNLDNEVKKEVASAMLEPVFWYTETGNITNAASMLKEAVQLAGNRSVTNILAQLPGKDSKMQHNILLRAIIAFDDSISYKKVCPLLP